MMTTNKLVGVPMLDGLLKAFTDLTLNCTIAESAPRIINNMKLNVGISAWDIFAKSFPGTADFLDEYTILAFRNTLYSKGWTIENSHSWPMHKDGAKIELKYRENVFNSQKALALPVYKLTVGLLSADVAQTLDKDPAVLAAEADQAAAIMAGYGSAIVPIIGADVLYAGEKYHVQDRNLIAGTAQIGVPDADGMVWETKTVPFTELSAVPKEVSHGTED